MDVELHELAPGAAQLAAGAAQLKRRFRGRRFDVVHAHFGLTAWPALAVAAHERVLTLHGTDVRHPRSRELTRAVLGRMSLVAAVSASLRDDVPLRGGAAGVAVLPCGVDTERFRPIDRVDARAALGLDLHRPYALFPADPARRGKRYDLARAVAGENALLTLGEVAPEQVPLWVNAANAVIVTSDAEGFGLAVLEALACDVPVLAQPVGIHPLALDGIAGTLCAPFDEALWRAHLQAQLALPDPRVSGRERAYLFSASLMARRVAVAWRALSATP
jgi:teichuronic acid biosynthesis glycosyltransferase TuaC